MKELDLKMSIEEEKKNDITMVLIHNRIIDRFMEFFNIKESDIEWN